MGQNWWEPALPTSPTDTATRLCAPGGCVPTRSSDSPGWRQNLWGEGL